MKNEKEIAVHLLFVYNKKTAREFVYFGQEEGQSSMTFQQIRYIVEIARCGSITQAANHLYIAQSALSGTIKDLEAQLGVMLFDRSSKGVKLTDEGRQFLSYVEPLLTQHDRIMDIYAHQKETPALQVSVSLMRFVFIVKALISVLRGAVGDQYEIHIREVGMHQVMKDVHEGKSQIGFLYISDATQPTAEKMFASQGLIWTPIVRMSPRVFFRKDHPMAAQKVVSLADMAAYPLLIFEEEDFVALDYAEEISPGSITPNARRLYINDRATMVDLICHTDAYSIGTAAWSEGYTGYNCMVGKIIADHEDEVTIGYIQKEDNRLPAPLLEKILKEINKELL